MDARVMGGTGVSKVDTTDSKLTSLRMIKNGIQKGWNLRIHFCFADGDE